MTWDKKKVLAGCGAVLLLASCIIVVRERPESAEPPVRGEFRKTVSFEPEGSISLENRAGTIEIAGWERNEVAIIAEGPAGEGDDGPSPDVRLGEDARSLWIRSGEESGLDGNSALNYVLSVPHAVDLRDIRNGKGSILLRDIYGKAAIDLDRGDVRVANFSGTITIAVARGSVDAEVLDVREGDEIRIIVTSGDIVIRLQTAASARIEALAPNGTVSSEIDMGKSLPASEVTATLGTGPGASIRLEALDGDIAVRKTD
ncbi:MAG: DUF4097 family beta strand repeat-containing protein [Candidatus Aminicenantales bacterium]